VLYADYPEFHGSARSARLQAEDLRADYDLGQAQALLYSAERITVEAGDLAHRALRAAVRLLYGSSAPRAALPLRLRRPNSILRHTHA